MNHRISVIIPCHNGGAFLPQTLESVLAQTKEADEIIVVNDGSTDPATLDLLGALPSHVRVVHKANEGLGRARNSGIEASSGDFLLMLDDDDLIAPECLAKMERALEDHPEASWVGCQVENFGVINELATPPGYNPYLQLNSNHHVCTALFRRAVFDNLRYPRMLGFEDWSLWLSCAERGLVGHLIDEPLFRYRRRAERSLLNESEGVRHELLTELREQHPNLYSRIGQARLKARWAPGLELFHAPEDAEQVRALVQQQSFDDVVLTPNPGYTARQLLSLARGKFIVEIPTGLLPLVAAALPSFLEQVVRLFEKDERLDAVAVPTDPSALAALIRAGVHRFVERCEPDDLVFGRTHSLAQLTEAAIPVNARSQFLLHDALDGCRILRFGKDFFRQLRSPLADLERAQRYVGVPDPSRAPSDGLPWGMRRIWKSFRANLARSLGEAETAELIDTLKVRLGGVRDQARRAYRVADALFAAEDVTRSQSPKLLSAHRRQEVMLLDDEPVRFERLTAPPNSQRARRILLIAPSLSDSSHGESALRLAKLIRADGRFEISLITYEPSLDHLAALFSPLVHDSIDLDRILSAHQRVGYIAEFAQQRSISLILMVSLPFAFDAARALRRRMPQVPIAALWDDASTESFSRSGLRGIDLHLFVGEDVARRVGQKRSGAARFEIVPLPCQVDLIDPQDTSPGWIRARLRLPPDAPLVGGIGPLEETNKPLLLVKVFSQVRSQWSKPERAPHFVFVGSGSMEDAVRRECAKTGLRWNTHFLAADMPRAEILSDLRLAVWANFQRAVPGSVLEAMAMAVPVVGPHTEASAKAVPPGTGVLVPRLRNQEQLAERLSEASLAILENDERQREMGRLARQHIVKHFGDAQAQGALFAFIDRLLEDRRPTESREAEVHYTA